ncbi:MAG: peptide deformylase [Calditrichaeota bacterium]|nr:peptide deformylase [Calditrichota bacterium]
MSLLKVRIYGDPVLRQMAEEVSAIDETVRQLVDGMFDTMYAEDGVGLAAPQVGVSKRIFIIDLSEVEGEPEEPMVFINPRIIWKSDATSIAEEGCLSIPGIREDVKRSKEVEVEALNEKGERVHYKATGLFARAILHENDHLKGVLFVDYLGSVRKMMIKDQLTELERRSKMEQEAA